MASFIDVPRLDFKGVFPYTFTAGATPTRAPIAPASSRSLRGRRPMFGLFIEQIQKSGISSLRGVARALTARGIKTARGGEWTAQMVINVLERGAS